jgi:hypothetical protein
VDEFIDAPRVLFGETEADVVRRLGQPASRDTRMRPSFSDPTVTRRVERLVYQGIVVELQGRLVRVELTAGDHPLPWGLSVGAQRQVVEDVLGRPQRATDDSLLYLYSDGFPKTVTFQFRDGRVRRIEWEYWIE